MVAYTKIIDTNRFSPGNNVQDKSLAERRQSTLALHSQSLKIYILDKNLSI